MNLLKPKKNIVALNVDNGILVPINYEWVIEVYTNEVNNKISLAGELGAKKLIVLANKVSTGRFYQAQWNLILISRCNQTDIVTKRACYNCGELTPLNSAFVIPRKLLREFFNIEQLYTGWLKGTNNYYQLKPRVKKL